MLQMARWFFKWTWERKLWGAPSPRQSAPREGRGRVSSISIYFQELTLELRPDWSFLWQGVIIISYVGVLAWCKENKSLPSVFYGQLLK